MEAINDMTCTNGSFKAVLEFAQKNKDNDSKDSDPKDNDPKGNEPVYRAPTNAEIAGYLRQMSLHFAMFKPFMDESFRFHQFEFRTDVGGTPHIFEAQFTDLANFKVYVTSSEETLAKNHRGNACKSLLYDRCFRDVEAFAVACRNALGDDLDSVPLAGSIFVNGKCVDELLEVLQDMAIEEQKLANEVKHLKEKMHMTTLTSIVTEMLTSVLHKTDFPQHGE
jgi:hypothetical protein